MRIDEITIDFPEKFDEEEFFTTEEGYDTLANVADIPKQIPTEELQYLSVEDYYWLNKPYSFALICHSSLENEYRYYAIEPCLNAAERELLQALNEQVRQEFDYGDMRTTATKDELSHQIQQQVFILISRFGLVNSELLREHGIQADDELLDDQEQSITDRVVDYIASKFRERIESDPQEGGVVDGESGLGSSLSAEQIDKLIYYLNRDYIGVDKIDPFTHDISVEDISVDGWGEPVFVHHTEHEMLLTNVEFAREDLDRIVKQLAQNTGKGISKSQPNVETTLEGGSRAQLTLGTETTTKGSNFTIRQFKDIPFTPVDLVNWGTYSLDQMALLWLLVESGKPGFFAGGTASGKTTTLNAASLYIDSKEKIASIEDTPELELPQRNWVQHVTRQSSRADGSDRIDMFELLETALRQRPSYIVMGEIRGEEASTLFQAMTSGHTTFTTFHADSPQQVRNRLTNDPINISDPLFSELGFICIQRQVKIDGNKVRRTPIIAEVVDYDEQEETVDINPLYHWNAGEDTYEEATDGPLIENSSLLEELRQERGWDVEKMQREWDKRRVVLAYLINNGISKYAAVGGVIQGFMQDEEIILSLIHDNELEDYLNNLRTMKTVNITDNEEMEGLVPRPSPDENLKAYTKEVLDETTPLVAEFADRSVMESFAMTEVDEDDDTLFGTSPTTSSTEDIDAVAEADENPFATQETELLSATETKIESDAEHEGEDTLLSDPESDSDGITQETETRQTSPASGADGTVRDDREEESEASETQPSEPDEHDTDELEHDEFDSEPAEGEEGDKPEHEDAEIPDQTDVYTDEEGDADEESGGLGDLFESVSEPDSEADADTGADTDADTDDEEVDSSIGAELSVGPPDSNGDSSDDDTTVDFMFESETDESDSGETDPDPVPVGSEGESDESPEQSQTPTADSDGDETEVAEIATEADLSDSASPNDGEEDKSPETNVNLFTDETDGAGDTGDGEKIPEADSKVAPESTSESQSDRSAPSSPFGGSGDEDEDEEDDDE